MPIYLVKQKITYLMEVEADSRAEAEELFTTDECDDVEEGKVTVTKIVD